MATEAANEGSMGTGRRTLILALAGGDRKQWLVEAGSTLLVTHGSLALNSGFEWLAGTAVAAECRLAAEESHCFERDGWITLRADGSAEAVLIPPGRVAFWTQVGRCLAKLAAGVAPAADTGCRRTGP